MWSPWISMCRPCRKWSAWYQLSVLVMYDGWFHHPWLLLRIKKHNFCHKRLMPWWPWTLPNSAHYYAIIIKKMHLLDYGYPPSRQNRPWTHLLGPKPHLSHFLGMCVSLTQWGHRGQREVRLGHQQCEIDYKSCLHSNETRGGRSKRRKREKEKEMLLMTVAKAFLFAAFCIIVI